MIDERETPASVVTQPFGESQVEVETVAAILDVFNDGSRANRHARPPWTTTVTDGVGREFTEDDFVNAHPRWRNSLCEKRAKLRGLQRDGTVILWRKLPLSRHADSRLASAATSPPAV